MKIHLSFGRFCFLITLWRNNTAALTVIALAVAGFTAATTSSQAYAWGSLGHRTIGEIAERNVCPAAKAQAHAILNVGETFASAAAWADTVRRNPDFAAYKPWHFVDMPLGSKYAVPGKRGDLVTALHAQLARLKDASSDAAAKAEALRLILHFVGDAHQPLHAGARDDGGGNGELVNWYGTDTNLHHVWDGEFLYRLKLTYTALADMLIAEHSTAAAVIAAVTAATTPSTVEILTPEDWVNESSALAKQIYPTDRQLGDEYFNQHLPEVKQRLWLAGMRLAMLLNQQLGCSSNLAFKASAH